MMKILKYIWSAVVNMPSTWLSKCSLCYPCLLFFMQSFASTTPRRWILIWSLWKVQCLIKIGLPCKNGTDLLKHNSVLTNVGKQRFLSRGKQITWGRNSLPSETGRFPLPVNMLSFNVLIWIHKGVCRLWQCSVSYLVILSAVTPVTSPPSAVSKIVQFSAHS